MRCVFVVYSKLAEVLPEGCWMLPELLVWFLLLGIGVLLSIEAAGAAVNLVAL